MQEVLIAPRSPWHNPYMERLIGLIRRDCLEEYHGLASYNDVREAMGLARKRKLEDISDDPEVVQWFRSAYSSVDCMDV